MWGTRNGLVPSAIADSSLLTPRHRVIDEQADARVELPASDRLDVLDLRGRELHGHGPPWPAYPWRHTA